MNPKNPMAIIEIPPRSLIQKQRQFLKEIQPFVEMKAHIAGMQNVRYYVVDDQLRESEIVWSPGSKEMSDQIDEIIKTIQTAIFK